MEPETVESVHANLKKFGIYDYLSFCVMLIGCALIGLYYAFASRRKDVSAADEYLMGGRTMQVFPVAMSLAASMVSGISFLGTSTEIYLYGIEYLFFLIPVISWGFVSCFLFLPVFYNMRLSSTYEYLERRFDISVRLFGSLLFTIMQIVWLPIVIYVPALAFNHVTGLSVHIITPCVCLICIFYTCVGGLKAVVWTDVIQTLIMIGTLLLIILKGTSDLGGVGVVWKRSWEGDRIVVPSFDVDFTIRHSIWSIFFGVGIAYIGHEVLSQNMVQRYMSLPTLLDAKKAFWIFIMSIVVIYFMCSYTGLVLYSTYYGCDPLTTKLAKKKDQLLPLLVMKILGDFPGLPGIFVAGIFSASLSSLSTSLNSMSAIVLEDFVKPCVNRKLTERATNIIMRGVVLVFGFICVGLVFIVERLGTVLQVTISLGSMANGPQIGIFVCGLFLPWVNEKGALFGGIIGLILNGILIGGSQTAVSSGNLKFPTKPVSVESCNYYYNSSVLSPESQFATGKSEIFTLFKLSYLWYSPIGAVLTIIFALLISWATGFTDLKTLDPLTVSPLVRNRLLRTESQKMRFEEAKLINKLKT